MSVALPELVSVAKCIDEASAVLKRIATTAEESMGQVEASTKKVELTQKEMTAGLKNVVVGFSGVATSAFALYNAYDRVQDMQVSVSRANLTVQSTLNSVEDAQRRYNATVEKYGIESEQAVAAAKDLQLAQERYSVAVQRAEMMQGNLNEMMVQSALSVIPTMITMINSLVGIKKAWAAAQAALNVVMNANPIMLVVTAIGLLTAAIITAYYTYEPFRNAVNAAGAALMNILKPAIDFVTAALKPLIDAISGVASWFGRLLGITGQTSTAVQDVTTNVGKCAETVSAVTAEAAKYTEKVEAAASQTERFAKATFTLDAGLKDIQGSALEASRVLSILEGNLGVITAQVVNAAAAMEALYVPPEMQGVTGTYIPPAAPGAPAAPKPEETATPMAFECPICHFIGGWKSYARHMETAHHTTPWSTVPNQMRPPGYVPGYWFGMYSAQFGFEGLVSKPTAFLAGEAGPEYVSVMPKGKAAGITINGPLVNIEGSADLETAKMAAALVAEKLRNVLVEASSGSAPATHKRIRFGGLM